MRDYPVWTAVLGHFLAHCVRTLQFPKVEDEITMQLQRGSDKQQSKGGRISMQSKAKYANCQAKNAAAAQPK